MRFNLINYHNDNTLRHSRLFLARNSTFQTILEVKKVLSVVKMVKLLNIEMKTCEKDVFMEIQNGYLVNAGHQFEDSLQLIIRDVQSVLTTIHNLHGNATKEVSEAFSDSLGDPEKAKSLVQLREEKLERKRLQQNARFEFGSMPDFIRFVDYLVVETLVGLTLKTVEYFYEELMKSRKAGLFEATVRFNASGTYFSPTCGELVDSIYKLFDNMVNTVGGINRVCYLSGKSTSGGPNVQSIIRENRQFTQTLDLIKEKIVSDYERAEEHTLSFEPVRPIYDFNLTWDFDAYRSQQHDIASLKSMMELISNWSRELEKLRNKPIGILDVDSRRLKAELNPIREARLNEIKTYIVEIARERCGHLVDHYKECLLELSNRPSGLKDYAAFLKGVAALREGEKNLFKATSQVDQLYNLLQLYEINVDVADLTQHEDLHDRQTDYRREFEVAIAYKNSKLSEMVSSVDVNITKLNEQVSVVVAKLKDPVFIELDMFGNAGSVVEDLTALGLRLDNVDALAKTYEEYQRLFSSSVHEQKELEAGKEQWAAMKQVWELVAVWNEKQSFWMESEFSQLPVEDIGLAQLPLTPYHILSQLNRTVPQN